MAGFLQKGVFFSENESSIIREEKWRRIDSSILGRTVANLLMIHDSRGSFLVLMQAASARNERYKNRFVRPINLWRSRLEALNRCFHLNQSEIFATSLILLLIFTRTEGRDFVAGIYEAAQVTGSGNSLALRRHERSREPTRQLEVMKNYWIYRGKHVLVAIA